MGQRTGIQWSDSTVNPTTGCDGCELWQLIDRASRRFGGPCYAGNQHEGRMALAMPKLYAPSFTEVRLAPGRMAKAAAWPDLTGTDRPDKPWLNGMPRVIFVEDMGDLFSRAVPFEYIHSEVIETVRSIKGRRHIYMILTKQPERMAEFASWLAARSIGWPENLWAGTSLTKKSSLWRVRHLFQVPAAVRFLSVEPMLEALSIRQALWVGPEGGWEYEGSLRQIIKLVIIGGESDQDEHRGRPFDVQWARDLIGECREAGVSAFVKQLGSHPYFVDDNPNITSMDSSFNHFIKLRDSHGGDWSEWADFLRVREFPQPQREVAPA